MAHPCINRVEQILNRKRFGPAPRRAEPVDTLDRCLVARIDGTTKWLPLSRMNKDERGITEKLEFRFPRLLIGPCAPVSAYLLMIVLMLKTWALMMISTSSWLTH